MVVIVDLSQDIIITVTSNEEYDNCNYNNVPKNTSIIISYEKVEQRKLLFFIVAHHSWSNQNVAFSIYWTKYIQVYGISPKYGVNYSLFYIVLLRNPSLCSIKYLPETYGSLTLEYMSGIEILNSRTQQPNRR